MELSVEQIFAADHATVSRYTADHPECIEPAVHDYLLSHAASARDALKTCLWILCGGEGSPAEVKQEVEKRRAGKSNVCGRIWQNGDMAYKCRNCGYDEPWHLPRAHFFFSFFSAVCVECFQEGDHKGHDYLLIQVAGGCCDCGDPLAWRPEGNCRHHVGTSGVDPSELLTPRQRTAARATLRAVVRVLAQTLLRVSRLRSRLTPVSSPPPIRHLVPLVTQPVTNEEVQAIAMQVGQGAVQCGLLLNWLQHVVDFFGDPLRRMLCLAVDDAPLLAGGPDDPPPAPEASAAHKLIIQFLLMDHLLPDPLQDEVRKWYFTLIGDTQYKMLFSIYYVQTYPFLVDVYIEEKTKAHKSKYETVLTMSTQFFHPHLIPHLVQNAGLLDMLVDTTYRTLRTAFLEAPQQVEEAGEERGVSKEIDTSSAVLRKRLFWILCYDLRAVTAVPAVVQPLVTGALATLERLVRLWDLFQSMDPTPRRRVQSHVPVESNSWVHAFTLEIEMIEAVTEQVADGVEVLTEEAQPETLAHARTALRRCLDALLSAAPLRYRLSPDGQLGLEVAPGAAQTEEDADGAQESEDVAGLERPGKPAGTGQLVALPWAGGRYRVADYDVHRHSGVSFHIPLHRLLTRLLVAASLVWRAPLHSFLPDASKQDLVGYALSLLEAPLRIQVLASQASSGAWVRNGYGLIQASSVYTTQVEAEGMMNADVATLQVAATLLRRGLPEQEADLLVPALLHRFTLSRYFDWAAPEADDDLEAKHKQALAENFLRLAIHLLNDRTVVGPPLPPADEGWMDEHHRLHMQDLLVRTVVHALACGPKTHSQVVKAVGERMLKHRHGYFPHVRIQTLLEQVMAQTADFTPPSGPSHPTGTFALKPACLALFDPYYLHYTRQEQQAAIEFYHATAKKLRPAHASGVALPSLRAVPEVIREGAASVACSRTLMAVLFAVLHHIRAARQPDAPASTLGDIALLHPTLTLLKLLLQFHAAHPAASSDAMDEETEEEEACEVGSLFDVQFRSSDPAVNMCRQFVLTRVPGPDDQPVKESVLLLLLQLRAQESDDLAEYRDALTEVVGLVETHGGARVQAALSQLTVLLDEERRAREAAAQKEALRRRRLEENKARQQAILAKFAAQQKAFVETAARQEGAAEEGEADDEEEPAAVPVPVPDKLAPANGGDAALADGAQPSSDLVCVLCKEGAQPGKGLGYVALVQHSHVLPVAKRQHVGKLHRPHYRLLADFLRPSSSAPLPPRDSPPADRKGKRKAEGEEQEETPMETAATDQAATPQEEETTDQASGGGGGGEEEEEAKAARRKEEAAREEKTARTRRWCAELAREVEGSGGAVVNSCGHLMHPECRHQYSLSVARDSARGRLTVDPMLTPSALAQGAFRCPLCRSLGNALLPHLTSAASSLPAATVEADEAREWEAWLGRLVAAAPPPSPTTTEEAEEQTTATTDAGAAEEDEESVRTTLHDFATRVYCAQNNVAMETVDLVPAEFEPHLWSLAACMTSALELATRSDPVLGTAGGWSALVKVAEERRGSTLRTTCRALLAYGRTLLRGDRQRLRRADALLRRSLAAAAAAADEGDDSGAAFLRGDMFAHFVRRYFLDLLQPAGSDEAQQGSPLRWARLLYVGALAQAAVSLAATLCAGSALATDEEDLATETATAAAREEQKAPLAALLDGIASASDGALGLAHADWTAAQWARFAEELVHLLLPFARRVALFLHLCGGLPAPALPDSPASPRQELEGLLDCLGIRGGAFAVLGSGAESELVRRWLRQLLATTTATADAPRELQLVAPDLPFHFDRRALPFLYQDLVFFRAPAEAICVSCGQVPRQPGLCLFCNRLVCVGSTCCAPQDKPGECNTHALSCAGGEGVFLLARQTISLLLQSQAEHGCLMGSLYLDEHKEEDVGLKRGRPLYLDPARYEQLRTLWLDHQMAATITRRAPSQNVRWTQL